jgi:hypothetical protein
LGIEFTRAQFTPDLLPADLSGSFSYSQRSGDFGSRTGRAVFLWLAAATAGWSSGLTTSSPSSSRFLPPTTSRAPGLFTICEGGQPPEWHRPDSHLLAGPGGHPTPWNGYKDDVGPPTIDLRSATSYSEVDL